MKIVWSYPCSVCYYFHLKIRLIKGVTCNGIYLYTLWPKSHPPLELYIGPGTSPDHVWASKEIGHYIIKTVVVYLWGSVRRCEMKSGQLWCIIHRVTRVRSRDRKLFGDLSACLIIIIKFGDINVFERPTLIHLVIYTVLLMLILNVCLYEWIKVGCESNGVLGYLRRFWDSHSMHFKIHDCSLTRGIHHTGGLMGWWLEIERIDLHSSAGKMSSSWTFFVAEVASFFLCFLTHEIHFYAV